MVTTETAAVSVVPVLLGLKGNAEPGNGGDSNVYHPRRATMSSAASEGGTAGQAATDETAVVVDTSGAETTTIIQRPA